MPKNKTHDYPGHKMVNFRAEPETVAQLNRLSLTYGSKSEAIRTAVRQLAQKESKQREKG